MTSISRRKRPQKHGKTHHKGGKESASVLVLRKSVLTGKIVWLCYAHNKRAANTAYCRARKAEKKLQRRWKSCVERYQKWMLNALNEWKSDLPITQELTEEQVALVRFIQVLAKEDIPCDRQFYEHIIAEERCRREDKIARENRRMILQKQTEG